MSENNKLVSIVVPYYNGKEFIEETIISAKQQTYRNIEIIVIDDCSPRKEDAEYIDTLSEKYEFRLIRPKYNLGTASAIAYGIEHANGDYVAQLSHDDLFVADKIEKQVKFLEENPSKECVFAGMEEFSVNHSKVIDMTETIEMLENFKTLERDSFLKKMFLEGVSPALYIQTLCAKREFAVRELVPVWHKSKADVFPVRIHLCLNHIEKIGIINSPLTRYRLHDTNISNNKYKMFDLMLDTIMNACPKEYQTQAIARNLSLLKECYALAEKQKTHTRMIRLLTALVPVKSWRKKIRTAAKLKFSA